MATLSGQSEIFHRRYRIHGLAASIAVHTGGIVGLLLLTYHPWWYDARLASEGRTIQVRYASGEASEANGDQAEIRVVSDPTDVTKDMVTDRIEQDVQAAEALSPEEKLDRLSELSERLSDVSSPESVEAMAGAIQNMFGVAPRATEPSAEPVEGSFDFDTAQFHDVSRVPLDPSGFRYVAILLDAEGRTMEVEMDDVDGQTLYETMQQIKQNPLLEAVYRQVVMPLLDQMVAGVRQAEGIGEDMEAGDEFAPIVDNASSDEDELE